MGKVHPGRKKQGVVPSEPQMVAVLEGDQQVGALTSDGSGHYQVFVLYPFVVDSLPQGMELVKLFRSAAMRAYAERLPMGGLPGGGSDSKSC